jgi:RNA polymerase-binding protein DksA
MNQQGINELRAQLEQQKNELTDRVNRIKADITGGLEADSKEQAGQLENKEVLDELGNEAREELTLINSALQRMDDGSYGICTACGVEIDARRLAVRPHAARCIACAEG